MPRIEGLTVTPVAFRDPPLLNAGGVHEPFAIRSIIELHCENGITGLSETYGDIHVRDHLARAGERIVGLDVADLNGLQREVAASTAENPGVIADASPRTARNTLLPRIFGALEVAALDALGKYTGLRVCDLLGGAVREEVPFSAYLFYKFGRHQGEDAVPDPWGEVLTPEALVEEARTMVERHGFTSLKLKGGALPPDEEAAGIEALRAAFPQAPLRIDPNGNWRLETAYSLLDRFDGLLEYLEDPVLGIEGMAEVQKRTKLPLATNMCVVAFEDVPPAIAAGAIRIILTDHHFWGGLVATKELAAICRTFGLGVSMHSNSHLGVSLMAMAHVAAACSNLSYACDTHYPWEEDEVIAGGRVPFEQGCVRLPEGLGLGVELDRRALADLHQAYRDCGITVRDDIGEMQKHQPDWDPTRPRF